MTRTLRFLLDVVSVNRPRSAGSILDEAPKARVLGLELLNTAGQLVHGAIDRRH
jgi:hypothetical protein